MDPAFQITFDRFVAVSKPLMYKSWMTTKTCAIVIMIVWLGSFAVSLPSLPLTWARNERMVNTACKCTAAANGSVFILFSSIASFFLPMLIVLYFYAHIYVTVRKIRLNATRGVVNIRRRSPTTTTGGVTSMNNNTEFQEAFFEASTLAVSTMEVHNKKLFTYNRIKKSRKTTKSLGDEPKMEKIQDERATLLPPETPQHHRRISDGPVLRIHKGRYHARRLSGKKAVELKAVPPNKVSSASSITVEVPKADENDYVTRPWTNLKTRLAIPERLRPPPSPTRLAPSPDRSPSPSPSQLTLSAIGMPTDFDKAPETQKSISPQLSQRDLDAGQKQDTIDEEKNAMTTDMWLRLALPSQLVSAWAQRMLALHRYRRKLSLELRALKTVVMVTGCFFVCWTGFCVVFTMQALPTCHKSNWWSWTKEPRSDDSCIPDWIFNFFVWLGYANSAANPIVYGAMNAQFRRTFRRMMEKVTGRSRMI